MAVFHASALRNQPPLRRLFGNMDLDQSRGDVMGLGRGLLLWLLGIPLPIIILLAIFWR
jgi:hypothetical protein